MVRCLEAPISITGRGCMSRAVRRRLLACALAAVLCSLPAPADSIWGAFIETSDSSQDQAIVEAMAGGDLDTRLEICRAMGRRQDPDARALLTWLLTVSERGSAAQAEHLQRVLLESLFAPGQGPEALQQRYRANREVLAEAEARWSTFADPQLRGVLLRILPLFEPGNALPVLGAAGADIVQRMQEGRGTLPPAENGLALDFLAVVEAIGTPDFLDHCLAISVLSREKPVVERARGVVRLLRSRLQS